MIRYVNIKKPKEDEKVLALLRPYVREWFKRNFKEMIIHQKFAVELIHKGKNTLITAPTGSGKTLSSFLAILDHLFGLGEEGKLEDMVYCIYVSPLKALDNDIHRNLLVPLKEIREIAREMGIELPEVRIAVRTGDIPPHEKQKQLKKPPHILVTTPETIAIVLSTRKFKEKFRNVRWVVVDEIHELANSKRGVHLSLSLERLQEFVGKPFVRIGMGACLRKDQKIWLNNGIKPIGKFVEDYLKKSPSQIILNNGIIGCDISDKNVYVYAFDGEKICEKKILKVWRIPAPPVIGKIETSNGNKLFLTLNDRVLVMNKEGYEWKRVDEVKEGEKICCPLKIDPKGKVSIEEILSKIVTWKKLRCVCDTTYYHKMLIKSAIKRKKTLKSLCNLDPSFLWRMKFLSSISISDFYKICRVLNLNFWKEIRKWKISGKRPLRAIKLPSISKKLLRLLGLLASDGHNNGNLISLTNKNKEICELAKKLIKEEFGIEGKIRLRKWKIGNYWQLTVKSRALCEILNLFGINIGKKFKKIDIPEALLKLPNSTLLEFIYGFIDGDGGTSFSEKENKIRVGLHSTSEKIIDKIRYILLRSGISCSKEREKRKGKRNDLFVTRIFTNSNALFLAKNTIKGKKFRGIKVKEARSDFVPIGSLLEKFKSERKIGFKELDDILGVYTFDIIKRGYTSRSTLLKILKHIRRKKVPLAFMRDLLKIANNNLTVTNVEKVEKITLKDKYVYDLTVEDAHNFVAEGIIVHNTLEPLDWVARFLVGYENGEERDCTIVDARFVKPMDIKVLSPVKDIVYTSAEEITNSMYKLLHEMISKSKTTLIFTNTRSGTERVVHHLKQMFPEVYSDEDIGAHHSSVSREIRLELEDKLKKGLLKAIVSSTSLELGIDIGYIDLVVQLGSPKSIARGLQRIGRAGHKLHETSVGRIICMDRDDLVETAVMFKKAYEYFLDKIQIPHNCLDVLAQHLMGMSLEKKWNIREAFNLVRRSYCYRNLKWEDFLSVLEYLSGAHHSLEDKKVYGKIWVDFKDMVFGRRGKYARVIYSLNIGTIPDEVKIKVKSVDGKYIGSIEEEFLQRLVPGDVFVLAGKTYQFVKAKQATAFVLPVKEKRPTVPSWFSEQLPLSFELAIEIGKFREKMFRLLKEKSRKEVAEWLLKNYPVNEWAAKAITDYFYYQQKFLEKMKVKGFPSHERILVENYIDERGEQNIIFHSLYGRRVNDALSRAFAFVLTKKLGKSVGVTVSDNGFMLTIPAETLEQGWLFIKKIKEIKAERVEPKELVKLVKAEELEEILKKALRQTELVKRKFRHCATRALMILRNYKGYEIKVAKQQLNADRLIKVCEKIKEFPVLKETYREILEDYMDIKHAKEILEKIEKGKIKVEFLPESDLPSPFAHNLIVLGESDVVLMEDRKKLLLELHNKILERVKA